MSENIYGVYQANPITSNASTDLMYFGQSPYGTSDDAAMTYGNFSLQFQAPLTFDNGIGTTVTNTSNVVTVNATGGGKTWTVETVSANMVADNGYITNSGSLITLTLPLTAAVGTMLAVNGLGAGGWKIAQNAGQNIQLGSSTTTAGTGGSLASSNRYDSINLVCLVANTTWATSGGPEGNITVV